MPGTERLIRIVKDRLDLGCYTRWEREFLGSIVKQFDKKGKLSERQEDKLREVVRERWVQGKTP